MNKKNPTKFSFFTAEKKFCTLHGQFFVIYLFLYNTHDFILFPRPKQMNAKYLFRHFMVINCWVYV